MAKRAEQRAAHINIHTIFILSTTKGFVLVFYATRSYKNTCSQTRTHTHTHSLILIHTSCVISNMKYEWMSSINSHKQNIFIPGSCQCGRKQKTASERWRQDGRLTWLSSLWRSMHKHANLLNYWWLLRVAMCYINSNFLMLCFVFSKGHLMP